MRVEPVQEFFSCLIHDCAFQVTYLKSDCDDEDRDDENILEVDLDDSKQASGEKGPKRETVGIGTHMHMDLFLA